MNFRNKVAAAGTVALVGTQSAMAQIDVSGATTGISDGVTAVTAILVALVAAYGGFLGLRMAKNAAKRGG